MGGTILLIVVLLLIAMILIIMEVCTPMFGLIGLLALGCVGWAVYLGYTINGFFGLVMTVASLVALPIYIVATVKILPKTSLGHLLHLGKTRTPPGEGTPEADMLSQFVGRTTTAETILRPSGMIRIDGNRIVAQAESGMIEKGENIEVIRATGMGVIVRQVKK